MKTSLLNPAAAANGSEKVPVVQTIAGVKTLVLMDAATFAQAGTRPTAAELQAAIVAALDAGSGVDVTANSDGTITIAVDLTQVASADALATGLGAKQAASAVLGKLAALPAFAGMAGRTIKVNSTEDGFEFDPDLVAAGGSGVNDGTFGDIVVSGTGTKFTVVIATDQAYGAGWNGSMAPPTKNSLYAKIEALAAAIGAKLSAANVGAANGVAGLDGTGKVPAAQLPSYVDDVLEFSNTGAFPNPGETSKIYVALDTNAQWRWSGSAYVKLVASPGTTDAVPEGVANLYYTDARVRAAAATGLIQTVGAPAAGDSIITVLGKLWRQAFRALTAADMPASVPVIGGDGGMEVGQYVDFHYPSIGDGRDYAGRMSVFQNAGGFGFAFGANALTVGGTQVALITDLNLKLDKTGGEISGNLQVDGEILNYEANGRGVLRMGPTDGSKFLYYDGTQFNFSAALSVSGNITSTSDIRLKTNIRRLEGASEIVARLAGYRFTMYGADGVGVIAQEVEEVLPELVTTDSEGVKSVDYGKLVAVIIEDNNAMRARIRRLEALVEKLAA